jgi:hypothetical protein
MVKPSLILVILWIFLAQCAQEVIIDVPAEPIRLVAISHFTEGEKFRVRVTLSQPVYAAVDPEVPEEAVVRLFAGGAEVDQLTGTYEGNDFFWESHVTANAGVDYQLKVALAGLPPVEAISKVPAHIRIEPVTLNPDSVSVQDLGNGRMGIRIPLELTLPALPAENRYFAFHLEQETGVYDDSAHQQLDYAFQTPASFLANGRTLSLVHELTEPVVLVNEKFWSDDNRTLKLEALLPFTPPFERPLRLLVEWRTLSPEFYHYHLSLARQSPNQPLSDPDALFNNVTDGLGNFSGFAVSVDTLTVPF